MWEDYEAQLLGSTVVSLTDVGVNGQRADWRY